MNKKINWGILGLGKIANKFANDLLLSNNANLHAVASRSFEKAKEFAKTYNANKSYDNYTELVEDPEIDIVYIATPHPFHFDNTMLCLLNNKAVLCEKPMGMDSSQVTLMIKEAQSRNLFLMEGLWTRFIPATEKLLEIINSGKIGDIEFVRADFGFKGDLNLKSRLYDKKLGGGSLLDIGIYPIYLSLLLLGIPDQIKAIASMTETEVDSSCSILFNYSEGVIANLDSTIESDTATEAFIYGSKGAIRIHQRFHHANKLTISINGNQEVLDIPYHGNGYLYEIEEANNCLLSGNTESSKHSLKNSLDLISVIDKVKDQIGLSY
ncbi:Predicted dehydrogenase [Tenacibaculum sp. MAR_2009_124]|uniref:Gfo/Idh/MocA family protein n=1 Tax=Tenacibaculum sp. MAR_2009_124 TaxID=1250059 RepID=UPI0008970A26|nr:Gfo/Idh/MocA family oxidoreductase [Tenacibaculum sp. MAR_2009_124]SEB52022.1 Predicted dehydrogenase [Tenacibaculum sp. MAR_2009_124]